MKAETVFLVFAAVHCLLVINVGHAQYTAINAPGSSQFIPASQCGTRSGSLSNFGPYIVNGQDAMPGAWPWMAMVLAFNTTSPNRNMQCPPACFRNLCRGGSLLNNNWILTAAHCTYYDNGTEVPPAALIVKLGTTLNLLRSDSNTAMFDVQQIVRHPFYNNDGLSHYHDLALLRLSTPVQYTDYIRPICLPSVAADVSQYKVCVATGWGWTNAFSQTIPANLQQAKVQFLQAKDCYNTRGYNSDYQLCLNSSHCFGDGGGPTACQDYNNVWNVLGVSNLADSLCVLSSIDCRIPNYVDWINSVMRTTVSTPTTKQQVQTVFGSDNPTVRPIQQSSQKPASYSVFAVTPSPTDAPATSTQSGGLVQGVSNVQDSASSTTIPPDDIPVAESRVGTWTVIGQAVGIGGGLLILLILVIIAAILIGILIKKRKANVNEKPIPEPVKSSDVCEKIPEVITVEKEKDPTMFTDMKECKEMAFTNEVYEKK